MKEKLNSVVYFHSLNGEMIYIGSGSIGRAYSSNNRHPDHKKDMEKPGFHVMIYRSGLTRKEAFDLEYTMSYDIIDTDKSLKYFLHDMRGENNPMHGKSLTQVLDEENIKRWKERLSVSMMSENNGYRTEVIVKAPFENEELRKNIEFPSLADAKRYLKIEYGFSPASVDKLLVDKIYQPNNYSKPQYRGLSGLTVIRNKTHGKRI